MEAPAQQGAFSRTLLDQPMKNNSESDFVPVSIIALGAVAVLFGTVWVALREQQRLRRMDSDDLLADTAEVDTSPADIIAANEVLVVPDEPSELTPFSTTDLLPDPMVDSVDAYAGNELNAQNSPDEVALHDRFLPDDMLTHGIPLQLSKV